MKTLKLFILLYVSIAYLSCNKENLTPKSNGTVEFALQLPDISQENGRIATEESIDKMVVSIADASGSVIYSLKELKLFKINGNFISEVISLKPGEYKLTDFFLTNENDSILYLTPKAGSKLAHLVEIPLPIPFNVQPDSVTKVAPQVISVEGINAAEAGYANFGFKIIERIDFQIAAFEYNTTLESFQLTDATLKIENTGVSNTFVLGDSTNGISVVSVSDNPYKLTVSKVGYQDVAFTLTNDELSKMTMDGNGVLKVQFVNESDTWISYGLLPKPLTNSSAVVYDNKIYIFGGVENQNGTMVSSNKLYIYSPKTNTWSTGSSMSFAKSCIGALEYKGKVYLMGGYDYVSGDLNTCEIYDIATDTYSEMTDMPVSQRNFTTYIENDTIYVAFGTKANVGTTSFLAYSIQNEVWAELDNISLANGYVDGKKVGNKIYLAGAGTYSSATDSFKTYNLDSKTFDNIGSLSEKRKFVSTAVLNGKLYCFGGKINGTDKSSYETEILDLNSNTLSSGRSMITPRYAFPSVEFEGKIFTFGGSKISDSFHGTTQVVEVYIL